MKKLISIALCLCIAVLCGGCSGSADTALSSSNKVTSNETASVENENNQSQVSSVESSTDNTSSKEEEKVDDWRTHPEDYKLIALTYDDAPSYSGVIDNPTVKIIDTIARYEGRGTLFVVGKNAVKNGTVLLKYAADKGFELGNHTYSHESVSTSEVGKGWGEAENFEDFVKCQTFIKDSLGVEMKYLRPAGVHTNDALYEAARNLGLPCVSGNCKRAVTDYSSETSADMIVERVLANAFDGAIILLHGNNDRTAEATERLCEILYNDGYRFCTVDELFKFRGVDYGNLPNGVMLYGIDPETGNLITQNKF